MQDFAKDFYNSQAWKNCRKAYYKYRRGLCEMCMEEGILKAGEIVHHKIHLDPITIQDPNVALSFSNLQLLCRDHHAQVHKKNIKRYAVDENGHVNSII